MVSLTKAATLSLLISAPVLAVDSDGKVCRALVLSGGANKGSWEAGVLHSYVYGLKPEDTQYDIFSGVSIGAMNSGMLGGFAKGDEKNMTDWHINFWRTQKQDEVYKMWPGGFEEGLLNKSGILDSSPMLDRAREILKERPI